jgi:hypothetical protein
VSIFGKKKDVPAEDLEAEAPPGPSATAQATFSAMMKDDVAPALRRLGFKGSGQVFSLPLESHFALIGFQKSVHSDSNEVRVTANVSVIPVSVWEESRTERSYLPATPAPNTFYGSFAWQKRIGQLLPEGQDTWWVVQANADPASVAAAIIETVRDYALPAMKAQIASG